MADTLSFLSVAAFVIASVSLAAAVFFWFFFKISSVIGDLSGRNAKRSIEKMRAANAKTGNKIYRGSKFNSERGKVTDAMTASGRSEKDSAEDAESFIERSAKTEYSMENPETEILAENMAEGKDTEMTGLLKGEERIIPDMQAAELLKEEETTIRLTKEDQNSGWNRKWSVMLDDIILIHTDETLG